MLLLSLGSKGLIDFESSNFGAEEGDARVARVESVVVQLVPFELACGWSLHARTNRMCVLSENSGSCCGPVMMP
jgi:hypothetical protein